MNIGDKVKIVEENSRFLGMTGTVITSCSKRELLFIVFDDPTATCYEGLHFLSYEVELIK